MNYMIRIMYVFVFLCSGVSAVTVDIEPVADSDIRKSAPDTAVGDRTMHLVNANSNSVAKAYIRFALPRDIDTITNAAFTVVLADTPHWNASVDVYGLDDDIAGQRWTEYHSLTWNNAPGNDTSSDSGFIAGDTTNIGSFDVNGGIYGGAVGDTFTNSSSSLLDFLDTDSDGVVNILLGTTFNASDIMQFAAKEHTTLAVPKLTISYIPKPTKTVIIEATADSDIRKSTPDTAMGDRTMHLVSAYSNSVAKAYIRFTLPRDIDTIINAVFTVVLADTPHWNAFVDVYGLDDDITGQRWIEYHSLTWNNAPGNDTFSDSGFIAGDTTNIGSFAVHGGGYGGAVGDTFTNSSSSLLDFLDTDSDGVVNILLGTTFTSSDVMQFATKEHTTLAVPKLTLTYVLRPPQGTIIIVR